MKSLIWKTPKGGQIDLRKYGNVPHMKNILSTLKRRREVIYNEDFERVCDQVGIDGFALAKDDVDYYIQELESLLKNIS